MIGIVIVTYNSAEVIGACLDSCLQIPSAQMVVVDNNSSDATRERIATRRGVRLIANAENRGFAGAANQGIAALDTPYVLLLNPDAVLLGGVEQLTESLNDFKIAAAGGSLVDQNGTPQHGFSLRGFPTALTLACEALGVNRLWPANPINKAYRLDSPSAATAGVDQPAGAFLMLRKSAWAEIGGFDESFHPVWFEDVDLCRRLRNAGYGISFVPSAIAQHVGGHSAQKVDWASRQLYWYGSLLRYAAKHFPMRSRILVTAAVSAACIPRMILSSLMQRSLAPFSVYSKVVWLSGVSLMSHQSGGKVAPQGLAVEPASE